MEIRFVKICVNVLGKRHVEIRFVNICEYSEQETGLVPGSCAGEEEREPGTHCLRMCQVPLVTCPLLRYTKITVNFRLPPERLHCMVILPVGLIWAVFKSKTISL